MTKSRQKRPPKQVRAQAVTQQTQVQQKAALDALRQHNRRITLFLFALFVVAIFLRVANLTSQSLWADEGNSVRVTERPLGLVIDAARADVHPPGYYLLLWGWVKLFGQSEMAVRMLSVIIGVLTMILVYLTAQRLFGPRSAWLAGLCAAVSPFQVMYSQEVRMYILVAFWTMALVYLLVRWLDANDTAQRTRWGIAYALVGAAGLWTHYSFPIVLVALNLAWLVWWIGRRRSARWSQDGLLWLALHLVMVGLYLPWLPTAWAKTFGYGAISKAHGVSYIVSQALKLLSLGETAPDDAWTRWLTVANVGLAVFGVWSGFVPEPAQETVSIQGHAFARQRRHPGIPTLALTLLVLAPVALMVGLALAGRSAYRPKFFLVASPAFCLLVGQGISLLEQPSGGRRSLISRLGLLLGLGLVGVGAARSLQAYYGDPAYARADYRGMAALIHRMYREGDAVLLNAPNQWEVFTYYYPEGLNRAPVYPLCRARPPVEAEVVAELEEIAAQHDRLFALYWATEQSDPERIVERWLEANTFKASDTWYGDVRLAVYAVPQDLATVEMAHSLDDVRFGDQIALRGYTLFPERVQRGDILQIALFWEALAVPDGRFKVFVHLIDATGQIVAQFDGEPGGGLSPTTGWTPQEGVFPDRYGVLVPIDAPLGAYQLLIGLYDVGGAPRLPLWIVGKPVGDALTLATVEVR
ncbi:MAG: glycosyltransferase family 39 protein [Anaerolineae bacterium]|nr:glycosyltransferase family 39 protein [Anaerolineae bacterium]